MFGVSNKNVFGVVVPLGETFLKSYWWVQRTPSNLRFEVTLMSSLFLWNFLLFGGCHGHNPFWRKTGNRVACFHLPNYLLQVSVTVTQLES